MSVRRLSEFLRCPESAGPTPASLPWGGDGGGRSAGMDGMAISLSGNFSWGGSGATSSGSGNGAGISADAGGAVLQVSELAVPFGALAALTGPVGSGKSSLLAAVLGEMQPAAAQQQQGGNGAPNSGAGAGCGCVAAGSRVAYVPQDPWIMHGSVRWAVPCVVAFHKPITAAWQP